MPILKLWVTTENVTINTGTQIGSSEFPFSAKAVLLQALGAMTAGTVAKMREVIKQIEEVETWLETEEVEISEELRAALSNALDNTQFAFLSRNIVKLADSLNTTK